MTEIQEWIINQVGVDSWDDILEAFAGQTLEEIKVAFEDIFPTAEDCNTLAEIVFNVMRRPEK